MKTRDVLFAFVSLMIVLSLTSCSKDFTANIKQTTGIEVASSTLPIQKQELIEAITMTEIERSADDQDVTARSHTQIGNSAITLKNERPKKERRLKQLGLFEKDSKFKNAIFTAFALQPVKGMHLYKEYVAEQQTKSVAANGWNKHLTLAIVFGAIALFMFGMARAMWSIVGKGHEPLRIGLTLSFVAVGCVFLALGIVFLLKGLGV